MFKVNSLISYYLLIKTFSVLRRESTKSLRTDGTVKVSMSQKIDFKFFLQILVDYLNIFNELFDIGHVRIS